MLRLKLMLISVTSGTTCMALCLTKGTVFGSVLNLIKVVGLGVVLNPTKLSFSHLQLVELCKARAFSPSSMGSTSPPKLQGQAVSQMPVE